MTVKELHEQLGELIKEGHGTKTILLSDDDEGNGFHHCFYDIQVAGDDWVENLPYFSFPHGVNAKNIKKHVLVG